MKAAAEELGLKVKTYENVDARGQDASGKQVVIGPGAAELVQAAFATRESAESELLETQRGEYFVVRTDRVTPARVPALTEVEAKVVEAWQAEERRKLADAKVKAARREGQGRHRSRRHRQGARPRGADHQGGHALRGRSAGNYLTQPVVQELFKLRAGQGAVGAHRRRQRHRAPEARSSRPISPRTRKRSTASASSSTPWWPTT